MIYDYERDEFILSSGRVFWAPSGALGITEDGERVSCGWDEWFDERRAADNEEPLTAEERREIAEEMISRWAKFGGMAYLPKEPSK